MTGKSKRGGLRGAGIIGASVTGAGGALTTIAASACCVSPVIAPLLVGTIGASGVAWASGLKPYSGAILGVSFLLLAASFWTVYRPRPACDADAPNNPLPVAPWFVKGALWVSAVLWTASALLQVILP
jgi:mercuric ion transport protein